MSPERAPARRARRVGRWSSLIGVLAALGAGPGCGGGRGEPAPAPDAEGTAAAPALDPAAIDAFNRGVVLLELSRNNEAETAFGEALRVEPDSAELRFAWALARYYQGGELAEARAVAEALAAERPDDAGAPCLLGHLLVKEGDYPAAMRAFDQARQRLRAAGRDDYTLPYAIGVAARAAGDTAGAAERFREALEVEPLSLAAWYGLGQALMQLDRVEEGEQALARFEQVQQELWAERFEYRYRGMGPLMLAPDPPLPAGEANTAPLPALTALRAPAAGARRPLATAAEVAAHAGDRAWLERHLVCPLGSGAAVLDVDGDDDLDVVELRCDPDGGGPGARLLRRRGDGTFEDATAAAGLAFDGLAMGAAAGDLDGDGDVDLVISHLDGLALFANQGDGTFTDATAAWGLDAAGWCTGVTLADVDQDGDLDLHAARLVDLAQVVDPAAADPLAMFAPLTDLLFDNGGEGRWVDVSVSSGVGATATRSLGGLWLDLDGDSDLDLLQTDVGGPTRWLSNQRDRTFAPVDETPVEGLPAQVVSAATLDLDGDGRLDLAFSTRAGPAPLALRLADGHGRFRPSTALDRALQELPPGPGHGVAGVDLRGTGRPELMALIGDRAWLVDAHGARPRAAPLELAGVEGARGVIGCDLDRNGAEDLVLTSAAGVWLLRGREQPTAGWLRLRLQGQLGSNPQGLGAVIDARTGTLWQARQLGGGGGYLTGDSPELVLSLGGARAAELIRVSWPSGVRQPVADLELDRPVVFREKGLKSSCPQLFAWAGDGYAYVSDMLGAAALGLRLPDGSMVPADHDELIVLGPGRPASADGGLRLRLTEPLEEVLYLDRVQLLVVDHPGGSEVVPRERYQMLPPRDESGLLALTALAPLAGAVDDRGNDVAAALADADGWTASTFDRSRFDGLAETFSLELDLGQADPDAPVRLVIDGWVRYPSIEELEAAVAGGVVPAGLALDVWSGRGWTRIADDVGVPAGRPKTMLLELDGRFEIPRQRVRLTTNQRLHLDRVRVDRTAATAPPRARSLPLTSARLWRSGYPLAAQPGDAEPLAYDGDHFRPTMPGYVVAAGRYTRLGEVGPLLTATDDRLVVMSHGESVDLVFDGAGLAPPAPGFERTFAVRVDGWMKDQEPGTVTGETVAPLPWRGMDRYPPPDGARPPHDDALRRYAQEWNTRSLP